MISELPEPGELFEGRYRIDAAIGRGGFGCVLRAWDDKLDRPVALKLLAPEAGGEDRLPRFWREVDLSRRLVHPHTVRVHDFGISVAGLPFIVFELLDGESLQRRLQRTGPLSVAETRRIANAVAKSLMEAHALGIVHRDIKPANVFLCSYAGETDFVKVLDFGIAKAPGRKDLTQQGWLVGTPMFMAPEQICGARLTPSADLYSLGLLMGALLSGQPLVTGSTHEVIAEQLSDEPVRLPPELANGPLGPIVRRATEKSVDRRYASAAELLGDLEGALPVAPTVSGVEEPNLPLSVSPVAYALCPSSPPPPPPPRARRPLALALAAALAAATTLSAAGAVVFALLPEAKRLEPAMLASDPSLAPALVLTRARQSGFTIGDRSVPAPCATDYAFRHALGIGVLRIEEHPSLEAARYAEREAADDHARAVIRRGHRLLSVWATPWGAAHYDRPLATRLLPSLVSQAP